MLKSVYKTKPQMCVYINTMKYSPSRTGYKELLVPWSRRRMIVVHSGVGTGRWTLRRKPHWPPVRHYPYTLTSPSGPSYIHPGSYSRTHWCCCSGNDNRTPCWRSCPIPGWPVLGLSVRSRGPPWTARVARTPPPWWVGRVLGVAITGTPAEHYHRLRRHSRY